VIKAIPLSDRDLIVYGALGVLGIAALVYVIARPEQTGRALANAAGGLAVGVVKGAGDVLGLPDPADPQTLTEGRQALARGDLWEASLKLPAAEFFAGLAARRAGVPAPGYDLAAELDAAFWAREGWYTYNPDVPLTPHPGTTLSDYGLGGA
jgi:hypothetical protein